MKVYVCSGIGKDKDCPPFIFKNKRDAQEWIINAEYHMKMEVFHVQGTEVGDDEDDLLVLNLMSDNTRRMIEDLTRGV